MSFLIYLINGLSLGSIYAIIALGYTMVYGIAKMLNFAHGDFIMVGCYVIFTICSTLSGNTFVGWYTDQALTKSFDVTTPIKKSITLYAKWEATSSDTQTVNTLTLTIPSETGEKTENFTAGDFTITATSDKKVNVNSDSISLNGGGSITYRSIVATVNTTNEITITINVSGGSNDRYLIVADENGTSLSKTLVTGETLIIKASSHTTYYLYSEKSGLNVSTLTITY